MTEFSLVSSTVCDALVNVCVSRENVERKRTNILHRTLSSSTISNVTIYVCVNEPHKKNSFLLLKFFYFSPNHNICTVSKIGPSQEEEVCENV